MARNTFTTASQSYAFGHLASAALGTRLRVVCHVLALYTRGGYSSRCYCVAVLVARPALQSLRWSVAISCLCKTPAHEVACACVWLIGIIQGTVLNFSPFYVPYHFDPSSYGIVMSDFVKYTRQVRVLEEDIVFLLRVTLPTFTTHTFALLISRAFCMLPPSWCLFVGRR